MSFSLCKYVFIFIFSFKFWFECFLFFKVFKDFNRIGGFFGGVYWRIIVLNKFLGRVKIFVFECYGRVDDVFVIFIYYYKFVIND